MTGKPNFPWKRALLLTSVLFALILVNFYVDQNRTGGRPLPPMTPEQFREFEEQFKPQEMTPDNLEQFARNDFLLLDIYLVAFFIVAITTAVLLAAKPANRSLFALATLLPVAAGMAGLLSFASVASILVVVAATYTYVSMRDSGGRELQ